MHTLQIKDKDGNFVPIPAIKGNDGKSAYAQAKEGGYTGTEEEFIALLNGLTYGEDVNHRSDFDNPHNVTAEQVGLGNVDNTSDANKPVSTAQAEAISKVQTNLDTHIGDDAKHILTNSLGGVAIGGGANVTSAGGAVGHNAKAGMGFSGGAGASTETIVDGETTYVDAIQLGNGINPNYHSLQVYDYQLMDADGRIPELRLPKTCARIETGSYTGATEFPANNTVSTKTITFSSKPIAVVLNLKEDSYCGGRVWINGITRGSYSESYNHYYCMDLSWNGNSLTMTGYGSYGPNCKGYEYQFMALLEG